MATKYDFIDKVMFVVDRKDLDYQTMKEYDRFQKGAANGNASTKILEGQLKNDKAVEFIEMAFTRGYVPEGGMELNSIMPPINPFDTNANRKGKVEHVLDRIKSFFTKYFGFANGKFND